MKRAGNHLLSHTGIYLIARGLPGLIAFAAMALYTHLLDPAEYGRYALVLAAATLLNALLFQWLRLSLVRYLPAYRDSSTEFKSTLLTTALIGIAFLGAVALIGSLLPIFRQWRPMLIPAWTLLTTQAIFELCCEFSRAALRPWDAMKLQLTRSFAALALGAGLILLGLRWLGPIAGMAIGMAIAIVLAWSRDWSDVKLRIDRSALKRVAHYGVPLSITVALTIVISTCDRFLIDWRLGEISAGLYSVAVDFTTQTITMLLMIVYLAAFPLAVRAWEHGGREPATEQMRTNVSLLMALGLPCAVGLSILGPGMAHAFLGMRFRATAAEIMPLVALGTLLAGIKAYHFDAAFQFADRTIHQIWIVLVAAVLNVILNLIAIPRYGINGAAGASVIAYLASIALTVGYGRRHFRVPFPLWPCAQVMIATALMGILLYPMRGRIGIGFLALQVAGGALVYASTLLGMNFMHLRDHLREMLKSWKANRANENLVAVGPVETLEGGAS
jgi:O-antigen/teichoic acid export membrane protein